MSPREQESREEYGFHKLYNFFAIATALFSFNDFNAHVAPFQRIRVRDATHTRDRTESVKI
jgi:hypothetical protein